MRKLKQKFTSFFVFPLRETHNLMFEQLKASKVAPARERYRSNPSSLAAQISFGCASLGFFALRAFMLPLTLILKISAAPQGIPSPEVVGRIIGFLLPRAIRERCFEPYFEELKLDRIEKRKVAKGKFAKGLIELFLYLRLAVTYFSSLVCWAGDLLAKVSPLIRWLLFGSTLNK